MPAFARTIWIDYSGAKTPTASVKGLRVYLAEGQASPVEVLPPPSPRKYWTRRHRELACEAPTLSRLPIGLVFYAGGGFGTAITAETGTITATTEIVNAIMTATMTTPSTHLVVFQGWGPVQTGRAR
jgi:hypothetical protein